MHCSIPGSWQGSWFVVPNPSWRALEDNNCFFFFFQAFFFFFLQGSIYNCFYSYLKIQKEIIGITCTTETQTWSETLIFYKWCAPEVLYVEPYFYSYFILLFVEVYIQNLIKVTCKLARNELGRVQSNQNLNLTQIKD